MSVSVQRPMPLCLKTLGDRGTVEAYHPGERRRCGACGCEQWHLGRMVATCARCEFSMPIVITQSEGGADEPKPILRSAE